MDPNVLGGLVEGTVGLLGGIVVTVFAFKVHNGKSTGKSNGHCVDHHKLAEAVRETREVAIETKTDVKWLVMEYKNGNGQNRSKN